MRSFVIKFTIVFQRFHLTPSEFEPYYVETHTRRVNASTFEDAVKEIQEEGLGIRSTKIIDIYDFEDVTLEHLTDPIEVMQSVL